MPSRNKNFIILQKVGPAMAGPTGPVPTALYIHYMHVQCAFLQHTCKIQMSAESSDILVFEKDLVLVFIEF